MGNLGRHPLNFPEPEQLLRSFLLHPRVLHVSWQRGRRIHAFSCFSVCLCEKGVYCFVFKSDSRSLHGRFIKDKRVGGTMIAEPGNDFLVRGIQFEGICRQLTEVEPVILEHLNAYPFSRAKSGQYFLIETDYVKYTDNQNLGYGNKFVWQKTQ